MKLIKTLLLFAITGVLISACSNANSTPTQVAEKFTKAVLAFDLKDAKKYVASKYIPEIDESIAKMEKDEAKSGVELMKSLVKDAKFEIADEKISEDKKTAMVTTKITVMGKTEVDSLPLIIENGEWKIDKSPDISK